ncbi:MAG TPA: hypothetical protein VGA03_01640 [Anaerolineales bacterium]
MRDWNLKAEELRTITIAADARFTAPNYYNDQVWELSLSGGEPAALALQTTYGLRARGMRLFPRFVEGDQDVGDPDKFSTPPILRRFYPNFLLVTCSPFPEIVVEMEYWVPQSDAVAGRIRVTNRSSQQRQVRMEWNALLSPNDGGERMAPNEMEAAPLLSGSTGDLSPVVFITGGAMATLGPFPALVLGLDLPPGRSRQFTWCHAACPTLEESFQLARHIASLNFDAERARLELVNAGQVEIHTGDPDWDLAFGLAQKIALGLFLGPTPQLPYASFVNARRPDHGCSLRGDGSDYGHLWSGQNSLDAYTITNLILPGAPELAWGLLHNFLSTQEPEGSVDWKPGMGGQRGNRLAAPLLGNLAWRIYQTDGDRAALEQVFPKLLDFLQAWFSPEHDRDGDGIPEWDDPMQAGFEDHPLFSRWHTWAKNVDITTSEGPALCAMLYRECQALIAIAKVLDREEPLPALRSLADNLCAAVESAWEPRTASYQNWDRDSHTIQREEAIGSVVGPGTIHVEQQFPEPVRLLLRIRSSGETTRRSQAFVHGTSPTGNHRVERIPPDRFQWYLGMGSTTSERTYSAIEYVEVQGLEETDTLSLHTAGFACQEQTSLLPLWAGIPSQKRAQAFVSKTITNPRRYWQPYGLPACPRPPRQADPGVCESVHLTWTAMVGEGMVDYGFRAEAAELMTRSMRAILATLKSEGGFRRYYHAVTGQGIGEQDALGGLPPLGLFLETLGVRLISPERVALAGFNPFPWPVTVKYRGLTVLRQKDKTLVVFPGGQTASIEDPAPRIVSLE